MITLGTATWTRRASCASNVKFSSCMKVVKCESFESKWSIASFAELRTWLSYTGNLLRVCNHTAPKHTPLNMTQQFAIPAAIP